jgi:hypothetical protein
MKKAILTSAGLVLLLGSGAYGQQLTLEDEVGDAEPYGSSDGPIPGRDLVRLELDSDGERLELRATLAEPVSGTLATDVVELYLDTDLDAATGEKPPFGEESGFEKKVELAVCITYRNGAMACAGGAGNEVKQYSAAATVEDLATGKDATGIFDVEQFPIEGAVVAASVPYADLGVRAGQRLRVYAHEVDGRMGDFLGPAELTLR